MRAGLAILACLALTACSVLEGGGPSPAYSKKAASAGMPSIPPPPDMGDIERASYACDDGSTFSATFDNKALTALIEEKGGAVTLASAVSGSGFRYADKTHELAGKADDAMYTVDGKSRHCTAKS